MKKTVIIVAGGAGRRMNAAIPKQFLLLKNEPVLNHTIRRFFLYDNNIDILVALPGEHISYWRSLCRRHNFNIPHRISLGGNERFYSVKNALREVDRNSLIGVHDGVRPMVSSSTIQVCYDTAVALGNAIPVTGLVESVRQVDNGGNSPADRTKLKIVQTPQVFKGSLLIDAYNSQSSSDFTDDASVVEAAGHSIHLVEGNRENIKITTSLDIVIASAIMENF